MSDRRTLASAMPNYRRAHRPGATIFLTIVTADRSPLFASATTIDALRASYRELHTRRPFETTAYVILPDHLHVLWRLPIGDSDYSTRVAMLKSGFTRRIRAPRRRAGDEKRIRRGLWQPRFWERTVRDRDELRALVQYIHFNPVKHGYATCPHAWPHSSFQAMVEAGRADPAWGCSCWAEGTAPDIDIRGDFTGEP